MRESGEPKPLLPSDETMGLQRLQWLVGLSSSEGVGMSVEGVLEAIGA